MFKLREGLHNKKWEKYGLLPHPKMGMGGGGSEGGMVKDHTLPPFLWNPSLVK